MRRLPRIGSDTEGLTTVEFVVVLPFFLIIVFYVLEVALAIFVWQSVYTAAQVGARMAVVSDPAVPSGTCPLAAGALPVTNCKSSGGEYGKSCAAGNCESYGTVSCTGGSSGSCNGTAFNAICTRMRNLFALIECSNITVSYSDSGLGFAGGPVIPDVAVSVSGVPFNIVSVPILPNIVSTMPTISVVLTGEDLSTSGGS